LSGSDQGGKLIVVRAHDCDLSFVKALKLLLVSFDATAKSNLSVGLSFQVHVSENDCLHADRQIRIEASEVIYQTISS